MAASSTDHSKVVLAAIIPNRKDLLEQVLMRLSDEHFKESVYRSLFLMVKRVYDVTNSVMTKSMMVDTLTGHADSGKIAHFESLYGLLEDTVVEDSDFLWSVEQLIQLTAIRYTHEALTVGMQALNHGVGDGKGELLKGHDVARKLVLERFAEIERESGKAEAPEGDIYTEQDEFLSEYLKSKEKTQAGEPDGVSFGVDSLDEVVSGLQKGELDLIVGSSSSGKTSLGCNMAWSASVEQRLNVVYFTSETLRIQVRRKIIARHSKMEKFGLSEGINTRDLRRGTLSEKEELVLPEILNDLKNTEYGRFQLAQLPAGATLSTIEMSLRRYQKSFPVDLCIIDYLNLINPERRRSSDWEEKNSLIKGAKQLASCFNGGKGLPVVSPWQVSRAAKEKADSRGYYDLSALAETAEATNSSDVIVSILEPPTGTERYTNLMCQVLKNRDGAQARDIQMRADYATCSFTSAVASMQFGTMFTL